jgi:hypothetical protein
MLIKEWIHKQKYIVKRFKTSKERLGHTCKLLPKSNLYKLTEKNIHDFRNNTKQSFSSYNSLEEKHYSLNVSHLPRGEYGTLEFRIFSSTTNFTEIKEAIYFVLTFLKESLERE